MAQRVLGNAQCLPCVNPVEILLFVHRLFKPCEVLVVKGYVSRRPPLSKNCHSDEAGSSASSQTFESLTSRLTSKKKERDAPPSYIDPRMFGFTRRSSLRFCVAKDANCYCNTWLDNHINRYVQPSSIPVLSQR